MSEPATSAPSPEAPHLGKKVTWAELFFDLVFVFAITELTALLHEDHSWGGIGRAVVVFLPIYWAWVGTSMLTNLRGSDRRRERLAMFAVALCGLGMAIAVPQAYAERGLLFACSYWLARIIFGVLYHQGFRPIAPFTVSMVLTGPLLVIGALLPDPAREVLWVIGALIDLAMPTLLRTRLSQVHFDADHLTERFGLFVLIAIGESIVEIGAPIADRPGGVDAVALLAVTAAFVVAAGLWWVYFNYANDAMRHALQTAHVQLDITRHVLSYGHVVFISAIVAVAVGLEETVAEPTHHLPWSILGLLYGGTALFLAGFGYTRWMMFRRVSVTRLSGSAVVVLLLPIAHLLPALGATALLGLVLIGLNVAEHVKVRRAAERERASASA